MLEWCLKFNSCVHELIIFLVQVICQPKLTSMHLAAKVSKVTKLPCSLALLFLCCNQKKDRTFFQEMKGDFGAITLDSMSFFLNGFGLERDGVLHDGKRYWKLKCKEGLFFLTGYLRQQNDSIMLLPLTALTSINDKEGKLLDFNAVPNSGWTVLTTTKGKMLRGDSIVYLGMRKVGLDSIFQFEMYPFNFFKEIKIKSYHQPSFRIDISRQKGFVSISAMQNSDTLVYCPLYPTPKLIDKRGGMLFL